MQFWHILAAKMAFIIIMEVRQNSVIPTPYSQNKCPESMWETDYIFTINNSSSAARGLCGEVLRGVDDPGRPVRREGAD